MVLYKDHPLSELLPMMEESEISLMAEDIRQHGQRTPITLYENKILDGRNRYRACQLANIEPKVRHFSSGDALGFIVSANVFRRHLTTSQRAMVAAKLANLSNGHHKTSSANLPSSKPAISQAEAAQELKVSERSVRAAQEVIRTAPKREVKAIERGEKTIHAVTVETKQKALKPVKAVVLDKTNYPIPESILADWQRAADWSKKTLGFVSDARSQLKTALDDQDFILAEVTNSTVADLNNAYTSLKCVTPYAVCTTCQGRQRKTCSLCKSRGWISEFMYRQVVPEETKKLREMGRAK